MTKDVVKLMESKAYMYKNPTMFRIQIPVQWLRLLNWLEYSDVIVTDKATRYITKVDMFPVIIELERDGKKLYRTGILILNSVEGWKEREEETAPLPYRDQMVRVKIVKVTKSLKI